MCYKGRLHECVYILDVFNNEIIAQSLATQRGDSRPYFECLKQLKDKLGKKRKALLHSDQSIFYSSKAFSYQCQGYFKQSMSRVGTPTDNPLIEAIHGWIKQELTIDYQLHKGSDLKTFLQDFVFYYSYFRPASALGYKTPVQYRVEHGCKT